MLGALTTENSPFSERQIVGIQHSLAELDAAQSAWLSGYLAGRLAGWPLPATEIGRASCRERVCHNV